MTDFREAILARSVIVAQGVPGVVLADRNKIVPSDTQLPAIIILDGSEEADDRDPDIRPANQPRRMHMRPVFKIILGGLPANVGTTLNGFRQALLNAIFADATLLSYTINGRGIRYLGIPDTGLNLGRALEATHSVQIQFTYPIFPGSI